MTILLYITSLGSGGAERVAATLANYWVRCGHSVIVVTLATPKSDFFALDARVQRESLGCLRESDTSVGAVFRNVVRITRLRKSLRRWRPTVAVAFMVTANCQLAIAGLGLSRTVRIGSEHGHPPLTRLARPWWVIRRRSYRWLHGVSALTQGGAAWIANNTDAGQVRAIPNPITLPLERHPPEVRPPRIHGHLLLSVGRLHKVKGPDRLLEAFAKLATEHPNWHLAFVGEGPERPALEAAAAAHGLIGRVHMPGRVGNLEDWYRAADLFALTSRQEGFGNVLVEAMAHGVPVVAVDCEAGPRAIVKSGCNGELVPQDDPDQLWQALDALMRDPERRAVLGEAGCRVRERYAVQAIAASWERFFSSATATNTS